MCVGVFVCVIQNSSSTLFIWADIGTDDQHSNYNKQNFSLNRLKLLVEKCLSYIMRKFVIKALGTNII